MKAQDKKVELTQKQSNTFRGLSKFIENRNYKKGLKVVDKLLEEAPKHPETISMRALFLYYTGEEEKATEQAKRAVMESKMQSLVCWQNYGYILRLRRDYNTALTAYKNAQKHDPANFSILRQLSNLQAQTRDYNGLCQVRYDILRQKNNAINNWLGLAMAFYLKGDYSQTLRTLSSTTNLMQSLDLKPPQKSNFNIYYCMVYRESGKYDEFYKQLKNREKDILDKVVYKQFLIDACLHLNKQEQAEKLIGELIQQFPENKDYFEILKQVRNKSDKPEQLEKLYAQIGEKHNSRMARLLELSQIQNEQNFKKKFEQFVIPAYKKNLISIFSQITLLYNNPTAYNWIGDVLLTLQTSLRSGKYPNGELTSAPTELLWSLYFRSQHLARKFENLPESLNLINEAINHTPTLVELYLVKARILQRQHEHLAAVRTINEGRQLDLSDRYMNNICIKFMLRALKPEMAETVMRSFMGNESTAYELQNMWYEIEMARCFLHREEYGPGLRHLQFVQKQFEDMYEDQYDFHSYSLYRWSLKEYVELVNYGNDIYNDRKYMQAAALAIKYLMDYAVIKDQLPAPKEYKQHQATLDYSGIQYLKKLKDPYQQASKWAQNVVSARYANKNNQELNLIYFKAFGQALNLFIHTNKPLLVLKALKKLLKTKGDPKITHLYKIKALIYFEKVVNTEIHATTKQIIKSSLSGLLDGSADSKAYNEKISKTWDKTPESRLREQQSKIVLEGSRREDFIQLYQKLLNEKDLPLKQALRLVHKLQFYRVFDGELKKKLNERYGSQTSYFSDWVSSFQEIKKEEWSEWWNQKWPREKDQQQEKQESKSSKQQQEKQKQSEATQ